jgi:hypothetical protein
MNSNFYKWQRIEQDSDTFVLRSSRPVWRWFNYWIDLVFESLWTCVWTFLLALLISMPFLRPFGEIPTLTVVFATSFLAFPISFFLRAKSNPDVTLELRFFCDQQKIELLGRSAFGFLVVHRFQLNESVKITRHCYEIDGGPMFFEEICIAFDANMDVVMEGLSPSEMEYHMAFFLQVLPLQTTKEILTTPNNIT